MSASPTRTLPPKVTETIGATRQVVAMEKEADKGPERKGGKRDMDPTQVRLGDEDDVDMESMDGNEPMQKKPRAADVVGKLIGYLDTDESSSVFVFATADSSLTECFAASDS